MPGGNHHKTLAWLTYAKWKCSLKTITSVSFNLTRSLMNSNFKPSFHLEFDPGLAWSSTTAGLPGSSAQLTDLGHQQVPCLYPKSLPEAAGAVRILIAHSKRGTAIRSPAAPGNHGWLLCVNPPFYSGAHAVKIRAYCFLFSRVLLLKPPLFLSSLLFTLLLFFSFWDQVSLCCSGCSETL